MITRIRSILLPAAVILMTGSCASLGMLVQPPEFSAAAGRDAELLLTGPSIARPLGGATLRIWTRVRNPNSFGLTLASLRGNVFLENERAGDVDFPFGLPLSAGGEAVIPIDISISFSDLPALVDVAQRIMARNMVAYRVDGTVALDAGAFGQPTFGPLTWISGESRVVR